MTDWTSDRVRQTFIDFFTEQKGHTYVPSAPVLPYNDPTLLFINSGMAQFKDIFLGKIDPSTPEASLKRAANSQKCIRAGGKHNDLDDVGRDSYHHTYFEMLGNWSFGDYFQEEAITWAWELLTQVYCLDPERIYVTYFGGDESDGLPADLVAKGLWEKFLPESRVLPFDKTDNFWEMGDTGPCGPCAEIHYDRIGGRDAASLVNMDDPNVIEIWNLVFMQYNREKSGALTELPDKHVDTGMGFERLTSILQDVPSNYDTDIFKDIFDEIQKIAGCEPYTGLFGKEDVTKKDTAFRIIADHIRTLSFSIVDGILPAKVGRGNVLRRIVRRAIRAGRDYLGIEGTFMHLLVDVVVEKFGGFFETLKTDPQKIKDILIYEQDLFSGSLDRGMAFFKNVVKKLERQNSTVLDGNTAFLLYSSHGFPLDLIEIICEDNGLTLDVDGFNEQLDITSKISHQAWLEKGAEDKLELDAACIQHLKENNIVISDDSARYSPEEIDATILALRIGNTENGSFIEKSDDTSLQVGVILDRTNFYAEGGGQIFDTGMLINDDLQFLVTDVQSFGGYVVHIGQLKSGSISVGDSITANVNNERREPIMSNHTATHMLNHALRTVFGEGVDQRGSLVVEDKFRFDFSYHQKITIEELKRLDDIINDSILQELPVYASELPLEIASQISGIRHVFGEKYPDPVRTVSVGASIEQILENPTDETWSNYAIEYCGGTHVSNTKSIQKFAIIDEGAKGSGDRRITAITGELAITAFEEAERMNQELESLEKLEDDKLYDACVQFEAELVKTDMPASSKQSIREQLDVIRDRAVEIYKAKLKEAKQSGEEIVNAIIDNCSNDPTIKFVVSEYDVEGNNKLLMNTANRIKESVERDIAVMLFSTFPKKNRIIFFATVPESLEGELPANVWTKDLSSNFGGRGGGNTKTAQGFHEQEEAMEESIRIAIEIAENRLN